MLPRAQSAAGTWIIDPLASSAQFSLTYLFFATLTGHLRPVEGSLTIDDDDPTKSAATASIDVTSLSTGIALRDAHLRSSEFFDASRYPRMTFRSSRVEKIEEDRWDVSGDLTVRDVTRQVTLVTRFEGQTADGDGSRRASFHVSTVLSRHAFGLGWSAGMIVDDEVRVTLRISALSSATF